MLRHISLDFPCHELEGLVDIFALFCRRFKEANAVVVGHLLAFLKGDGPFVLHVGFVADKDARDVVLRKLFNLGHPSVNSVEGVTVRDVVNHNDSVGSLVVRRGDSLESFLSSCVPNLEFADFVVRVDSSDLEVDADSWLEILLKLIVSESEQQAGLANT